MEDGRLGTKKEVKAEDYGHYMQDGWHKEPKRIFVHLGNLIEASIEPGPVRLLDVGCATGEFIDYIGSRFPSIETTGVDVVDEFIFTARQHAPAATFVKASALELPKEFDGRFDYVCATGVIEIFGLSDARVMMDNLLRCVRKGGRVYLLSPFNEFGMDLNCSHRKRIGGRVTEWDSRNNIYSFETIRELLDGRGEMFAHRFDIGMELPRRDDPQRTWTVPFVNNPYQLMNGLKLLMDLYAIEIRVG